MSKQLVHLWKVGFPISGSSPVVIGRVLETPDSRASLGPLAFYGMAFVFSLVAIIYDIV